MGQFVQEKIQSFSVLGALVNTSMLLISCMSFSLITVFRSVSRGMEQDDYHESILLPVSRISSIIIMLAYIAYIVFQLVTHKQAMSEDADNEDSDEQHLPIAKSMALLAVTTVIVAFVSEIL